MKNKLCIYLLAVAILSIGGLHRASGANTNDVFLLQASLKGIVQENEVVGKRRVSSADLVNLALGRPVGTTLAANEVLALVFDCIDDDAEIVVFDTDSGTVQVTIATVDFDVKVGTASKVSYIGDANLMNVGSPTNSIDDGKLYFSGSLDLDAGGCSAKVSATVIGTLNFVINGQIEDVLVSKGLLTTIGAPIATVLD